MFVAKKEVGRTNFTQSVSFVLLFMKENWIANWMAWHVSVFAPSVWHAFVHRDFILLFQILNLPLLAFWNGMSSLSISRSLFSLMISVSRSIIHSWLKTEHSQQWSLKALCTFCWTKTQCLQIYTKLTPLEDNDSGKLPWKYNLLRCCTFWEMSKTMSWK